MCFSLRLANASLAHSQCPTQAPTVYHAAKRLSLAQHEYVPIHISLSCVRAIRPCHQQILLLLGVGDQPAH